jgi:class 3 adenylate cyclase
MTKEQVLAEIRSIFQDKWTIRDGKVVPDTDDIALGNQAVKLDATVLYADMADSTGLVDHYKHEFAAEIYKAYLIGACRVISDLDGTITAFDGDRVMAVFIGDRKNTNAAKCALTLNALVNEVNSLLKSSYPNTAFKLRHTVGVDTSDILVVRTGIRNANDLVWVGRAANYAAKLSAIGEEGYPTYITEGVYTRLSDEAKYGGQPRTNMWEKRTWAAKGIVVYRSSWSWDL